MIRRKIKIKTETKKVTEEKKKKTNRIKRRFSMIAMIIFLILIFSPSVSNYYDYDVNDNNYDDYMTIYMHKVDLEVEIVRVLQRIK